MQTKVSKRMSCNKLAIISPNLANMSHTQKCLINGYIRLLDTSEYETKSANLSNYFNNKMSPKKDPSIAHLPHFFKLEVKRLIFDAVILRSLRLPKVGQWVKNRDFFMSQVTLLESLPFKKILLLLMLYIGPHCFDQVQN